MSEIHDAFKYCRPDAPTESGLYWPEQMGMIWNYCTYLGSIQLGIEDRRELLDLGVYPENIYGEHPFVYDATTYGPDGGDYISGELALGRYTDHKLSAYVEESVSFASSHIGVVLYRCLKHGIPVHAWRGGPLVIAEAQPDTPSHGTVFADATAIDCL